MRLRRSCCVSKFVVLGLLLLLVHNAQGTHMTGRNSAAESSGHSLADRVHAMITCLTVLTDAGCRIWVRELLLSEQ